MLKGLGSPKIKDSFVCSCNKVNGTDSYSQLKGKCIDSGAKVELLILIPTYSMTDGEWF